MNLDELLALKAQRPEPITVVHCGSTTRAREAFEEWRLKDTLAGKKVFTIGAHKNDNDLAITPEQAIELDILHLSKIDDADEVLILNVGRYIGESTQRELEYAQRLGKQIRWLEPPEEEEVTSNLWYDLYCGSMNEWYERTTDLAQIVAMIDEHVEIGDCFEVYLSKDGEDIGYGQYTLFEEPNYAVASKETGIAKGLWKAINEQMKLQEAESCN
jgi:hypothetical protein